MPVPVTAIGVDPGLAATGFAVVELQDRRGKACQWGTITTSPALSLSERLSAIYRSVTEILSKWGRAIENVVLHPSPERE